MNPVNGDRFRFNEEYHYLYDTKTNKYYEIRYEGQLANEEITKICLEILKISETEYHPRFNNLQNDIKISKAHIGFFWRDGEALPTAEKTNSFIQKTQEHLSKLTENKPIEIKEIKDPNDQIENFYKETNYSRQEIRELITLAKEIEERHKKTGGHIDADVATIIDYKKQLKALEKELEFLFIPDVDSTANLTDSDKANLAYYSHKLKHTQTLMILALAEYAKKIEENRSGKVFAVLQFFKIAEQKSHVPTLDVFSNYLTHALNMRAYGEKPSTLDDINIKTFIQQSKFTEIPLLKEIEQAKLHHLELEKALVGKKEDIHSLALRHELKFTECYIYSKERALLRKTRQQLINSIPKTGALTQDQIKKLKSIDKMDFELAVKIHLANEMRKRLKNDHRIAVKEKELPLEGLRDFLKTSRIPAPSSFADFLLKSNPSHFRNEEWSPLEDVKQKHWAMSIAEGIYDAVKSGMKKAEDFRNTAIELKAMKQGLKNEIDKLYIQKKEIEINQILSKSEKAQKIQEVEKKINELNNKMHLINLQRQNNELVKITDELGFVNFFIQKTTTAIETKKSDLEAAEIKLNLFQLFLKNVEADGKIGDVSEQAKKLSEKEPGILKSLYDDLKSDKEERKKQLLGYIGVTQKNIGQLKYSMGIASQEMRKAEGRIQELNRRFDSIMTKYEREWVPKSTENPITALKDWAKEKFLKTFSFGIITTPTPPHPQQLRTKKAYADAGYNFYNEVEKLKTEFEALPQEEREDYCKKLLDDFYEWGYTHPATATQIVSDVALTISLINPNKHFLDHTMSTLEAKLFIFTMLQEIGVKDVPKIENPKSLKFKAVADFCRYLPYVAGNVDPIVTAATKGTVVGAAIGGPFGAILGAGVTLAASSARIEALQTTVQNIKGADGANYLLLGKVVKKIFQSKPYVDEALINEGMQVAKDAITAVHALKHPEGIGNYIAEKVSDWWTKFKAANGLVEKIIRLSPAIAVTGLMGFSTLALVLGGPITIAAVAAAAAFVVSFLYFFHRVSPELDKTIYPGTITRIKAAQLASAMENREAYFAQTANQYADALIKKGCLSVPKPQEIPAEYAAPLQAMEASNTQMVQSFVDSYTPQLNQKLNVQREKGPIMREIAMTFMTTVDMEKLRTAVKGQVQAYIAAHPQAHLKDVESALVENQTGKIVSQLIDNWLKKELVNGAKEQFKIYFRTYEDEYAGRSVKDILENLEQQNERTKKAMLDNLELQHKQNRNVLQAEIAGELPGYKNERIAEEIQENEALKALK